MAAAAITSRPAKSESGRREPSLSDTTAGRLEGHLQSAAPFETRPVHHYRVHLVEPRGRLAQRAGRQAPAVAEAAHAVYHDDLNVARERIVLQSVVADDHLAVRFQQSDGVGPCSPDCDGYRHAPADHDSLVAHLLRTVNGLDSARRPARASIAAQRDADPKPAAFQLAGQPHDERRLAGAADGEVADHDDQPPRAEHWQDPGAIEGAA